MLLSECDACDRLGIIGASLVVQWVETRVAEAVFLKECVAPYLIAFGYSLLDCIHRSQQRQFGRHDLPRGLENWQPIRNPTGRLARSVLGRKHPLVKH